MKPRLKSAPLTFDDVAIWVDLGSQWKQATPIWMPQGYLNSDRRDADLMLFAQRYKDACCLATAIGNGVMVRCCDRIRGPFAGCCGDTAVYDITNCA